MKKFVSILILLACLLALGLVFGGCSNGSSSPTYRADVFTLTTSDFSSAFPGETATTSLKFASGDQATLTSLYNTAKSKTSYSPLPGGSGTGIPLADAMAFLDTLVPTYITASEKNQLIDRINTNGYYVAYKTKDSNVGVIAAMKE